jgi:hypothetical protein
MLVAMSEPTGEGDAVRAGLPESEMRDNVIRLAFGGEPARLDEFLDVLRASLPEQTRVVLRGSAVTGTRWEDGAPFDADGPGTSDLDLTLCGKEVLSRYEGVSAYYIPGVHTKPISEKDIDIAPDLLPLRQRLTAMVGRPVNIQGTRNWIMFLREHVMNQPYLTLLEGCDDEEDAGRDG